LVVLFSAIPLFAQQPTISYLMCDEAKSQLQIRGSFGVDSGSVSIEDTTLGIVSWSDSLIICSLPDIGKGAGGGVVVKSTKGISNKRILSIFSIDYYHQSFRWVPNSFGGLWNTDVDYHWIVNWRMDIEFRKDNNQIRFEASKSSYIFELPKTFHYYDTSVFFNQGFNFSGNIDLTNFMIIFDREKIKAGGSFDTLISFKPTSFDTTGFIQDYIDIDTGYVTNGNIVVRQKKIDSLYNAKILFPPNPKSNVIQKTQSNDPLKFWQEDHSLIINSETHLGPTTASLYTIDGRLLSQTKLDIPTAGIYTLDVSDVHIRFALLVLQTAKGMIMRKILLSEP
jgi:hypothetical protein